MPFLPVCTLGLRADGYVCRVVAHALFNPSDGLGLQPHPTTGFVIGWVHVVHAPSDPSGGNVHSTCLFHSSDGKTRPVEQGTYELPAQIQEILHRASHPMRVWLLSGKTVTYSYLSSNSKQ